MSAITIEAIRQVISTTIMKIHERGTRIVWA